jgi:predicted DNA-binding transcriptional regulator
MDLADFQDMLRALGAKHSEIRVLLALMRVARPLRFAEILELTGLSDRTVRLALRSLRDMGYVHVVGRGRSTRYVSETPGKIAEMLKKRMEERISAILTHLQFHS